jgi:hypothetical protein
MRTSSAAALAFPRGALLERAGRALRRFHPARGQLRPWLAVVFQRFVLEQLRDDARRRQLVSERLRPAASVVRAERADDTRGDAAKVRALVSELPAEQRATSRCTSTGTRAIAPSPPRCASPGIERGSS